MSLVDTVKGAIPIVKRPEIKLPESKISFAVLGAGDLALQRAKTELPSLPSSLLSRVEDARRSLPSKAQAQAQVEAQVELVRTLPALVTKAAVEGRKAFHDQVETLAARGELVAGRSKPIIKPVTKPVVQKPVAKKAVAKKTV